MESSAVLRSFNCSAGTITHTRSFLEKPGTVPACNVRNFIPNRACSQSLTIGGRIDTDEAVSLDCIPQGSLEKTPRSATFPSGFEALMLEVCDETEVAELKLKVGDFEMHLKRNIGATKAPLSSISPISPPPIPTKPMVESGPATPPPPSAPKTSPQNTSPFANVSLVKSSKLAALEASGSNTYVLVSSPTVGSFRRGRTVKGKKQPPICKEGDVIKEGQVIGYVDQFGTELPVKSDVGGEVLKVLFADGEAVGYGDPLIAVLPSFHGIK
ncbi:Lipoamide Acyltransferase [Trema orientale]|uniref:Lipoamide Acyltransferase n=1 Tax=Trema orientale TaxID=63057 RepID=A0A2P5ECM3_TREOI|nr:Lipoamide Acyltransferase [Trema orientale]